MNTMITFSNYTQETAVYKNGIIATGEFCAPNSNGMKSDEIENASDYLLHLKAPIKVHIAWGELGLTKPAVIDHTGKQIQEIKLLETCRVFCTSSSPLQVIENIDLLAKE